MARCHTHTPLEHELMEQVDLGETDTEFLTWVWSEINKRV